MTQILDEAELTVEQQSQACDLALRYAYGFKAPKGKTGWTDWDDHPIDAQGNAPVRDIYRPQPMVKQNVCDEEVEKMLTDDVIEPSNSSWAAPIVMVTKKDGSIRFAVDCRKLNSLTRKDAYPLPKIDDTLNTLGVQTGSAQWTWSVAIGRLKWVRKIRQRLSLWPGKGFSTSMSCHLGFPMHFPHFRDSWKRSWWAYNGKSAWYT